MEKSVLEQFSELVLAIDTHPFQAILQDPSVFSSKHGDILSGIHTSNHPQVRVLV